jgi:hypothetical protein
VQILVLGSLLGGHEMGLNGSNFAALFCSTSLGTSL